MLVYRLGVTGSNPAGTEIFFLSSFIFAEDEQRLLMFFFQNFAIVFLQFPQRKDAMYKIIVWKFISDQSTSEN